MLNDQKVKRYDLEERTLKFTKNVLDLVRVIPVNLINKEFISQIVRSSASVGANYREANEALGKKDFFMRVRISRKETKETVYWLELILHNNENLKKEIDPIIGEAEELLKIFSAIISKAV